MRWTPEAEEIGVKGAVHGRGGVNVKASLLAVNMVMVVIWNQSGGSVTGKVQGGGGNGCFCLFGGKGRVKRKGWGGR